MLDRTSNERGAKYAEYLNETILLILYTIVTKMTWSKNTISIIIAFLPNKNVFPLSKE